MDNSNQLSIPSTTSKLNMAKPLEISTEALDGICGAPSSVELEGRRFSFNPSTKVWAKAKPSASDRAMAKRIAINYLKEALR